MHVSKRSTADSAGKWWSPRTSLGVLSLLALGGCATALDPQEQSAKVVELSRSADPMAPIALDPAGQTTKALELPRSAYPIALINDGEEGTVVVQADLLASGVIRNVRIERSSNHPRLDIAAVKATYGLKMTPHQTADGKAVDSRFSLPLVFKITYATRIYAKIWPTIKFPSPLFGNPVAVVEIAAAPDGTVTFVRLIRSSLDFAWDAAVLAAAQKADRLPPDVDGRVPPRVQVAFSPK